MTILWKLSDNQWEGGWSNSYCGWLSLGRPMTILWKLGDHPVGGWPFMVVVTWSRLFDLSQGAKFQCFFIILRIVGDRPWDGGWPSKGCQVRSALPTCDGGKTKSTPDPIDLHCTVRLDWRLTKSEVRRRRMKTKDIITTTIILIKKCIMLRDILMNQKELEDHQRKKISCNSIRFESD